MTTGSSRPVAAQTRQSLINSPPQIQQFHHSPWRHPVSTDKHTTNRLVIVRNTILPEVFIHGTREGFLELLNWLGNPVDMLPCNCEQQEDVPPIIGFVWRSIDASILAIKVHDGTLCFEGAGEERSWLAEMVEFLLADGRESTGLHVEHYPGHPVLSENSAPLVLALTSQTH